jgi:hypothetical protein
MVSINSNIFNDVLNIIYFEWLPHTYQVPYLVAKTLAIKHAKNTYLYTTATIFYMDESDILHVTELTAARTDHI